MDDTQMTSLGDWPQHALQPQPLRLSSTLAKIPQSMMKGYGGLTMKDLC
jgi:hypothetical protein